MHSGKCSSRAGGGFLAAKAASRTVVVHVSVQQEAGPPACWPQTASLDEFDAPNLATQVAQRPSREDETNAALAVFLKPNATTETPLRPTRMDFPFVLPTVPCRCPSVFQCAKGRLGDRGRAHQSHPRCVRWLRLTIVRWSSLCSVVSHVSNDSGRTCRRLEVACGEK